MVMGRGEVKTKAMEWSAVAAIGEKGECPTVESLARRECRGEEEDGLEFSIIIMYFAGPIPVQLCLIWFSRFIGILGIEKYK